MEDIDFEYPNHNPALEPPSQAQEDEPEEDDVELEQEFKIASIANRGTKVAAHRRDANTLPASAFKPLKHTCDAANPRA